MDLITLPMCDTCAEEYPYMDQIKYPTCEACLYDNKLKSTDNPCALPPLKYCKHGCGMKLGSKAGTMCGGCRRKSEQNHCMTSNSQQMTQSKSRHINEVDAQPASQPFLVDDVEPARILAIRSTFQTPQLPMSQPASMQTSTSLSRHSIMPVPPVRQKKRPAENLQNFQSTLVRSDHDQAYLHGEAASKRIRLDRIREKNSRNTPRSTSIGRHQQILQTSAPPAPVMKQIAVKLKYNAYNGPKSHGITDYMHDIDFSHQDWEIKIMQAATEHFREKSVGIFPPASRNGELDINRPALPPFDPLFYSLGIGAGELSGDRLKQEILSPTEHHKKQRKIRGPVVVSLFFAAATYVASINTSSSSFDSDSEAEDGVLHIQIPKTSSDISTIINTSTNNFANSSINTPKNHFLNSPIISNSNWSSTIARSVSLAVKRIHQLADEGFDPLKLSNSVVVAAHDRYDIANTPFPQELATPLPDGHPAGDHQTITTISWTDALQLQLGIGRQIALFAPSWIRSFGGILPGIDSNVKQFRNAICWSNAILTALVKSQNQSTQEATLAPLVFGQWEVLAEVEHDEFIGEGKRHRTCKATLNFDGVCRSVVAKEILSEGCNDQDAYLTDSVVYHLTSCLLEQFKLAMFVQFDVTIAQKNLLNSLHVVFNMVMVKDDKSYQIEELLDGPPETICTPIDFIQQAPWSLLSDALHAFVHYMYDYFKGQALVCNIKTFNGRLTGMRMMDRRFQWTTNNEHQDAIDAFKLGHRCGEFCKVLKLESAHFKYPIPDDKADSVVDVAIDPILETLEHTHPKSSSAQSEAEHDAA